MYSKGNKSNNHKIKHNIACIVVKYFTIYMNSGKGESCGLAMLGEMSWEDLKLGLSIEKICRNRAERRGRTRYMGGQ